MQLQHNAHTPGLLVPAIATVAQQAAATSFGNIVGIRIKNMWEKYEKYSQRKADKFK